MLQQFQRETGVRLQRDNITLKTADGQMYVNATRVLGVDVFSPAAFTAAVLECYRQINGVARFLRERVPGFEQARIGQVSPILGVRETRHIDGEYTLSGKDSLRAACASTTASLPMRRHSTSTTRKAATSTFRACHRTRSRTAAWCRRASSNYWSPASSISADHDAHARSRNMPACMSTGQAAGVAAAIAIDAGARVRDVPVARVQAVLREWKMPLHPEEIADQT